MEEDTSQQIEQRLAELPEDVRNAVMSAEWEQKVQAVATKHSLHVDQSGALADVTLMAMLGFFEMADYPSHIAQELNIPADKAAVISTDISNDVFMPIRDSLRKFSEGAKAPPPAPVAPAAPQPPKPDLSAADAMLQSKTVSAPAPVAPPAAAPKVKEEPPKPSNYSADPYREPPL